MTQLYTLHTAGARLLVYISELIAARSRGGSDPRWGTWPDDALHEMLDAAQRGGLSAADAWEVEQFAHQPRMYWRMVELLHRTADAADAAVPCLADALTRQMEAIATG